MSWWQRPDAPDPSNPLGPPAEHVPDVDVELDDDTATQVAGIVARPTYLVSWIAGAPDLLYTEGVEIDYVGRVERGAMTLVFDGDPKAPLLALEVPTERLVSIVRMDLVEEDDDEDDDEEGPGEPDGPDDDPTPIGPAVAPQAPDLRLVLSEDMPDDLARIASHPAGWGASDLPAAA